MIFFLTEILLQGPMQNDLVYELKHTYIFVLNIKPLELPYSFVKHNICISNIAVWYFTFINPFRILFVTFVVDAANSYKGLTT